MEAIYSAIIISAAVFILVICLFSPVIEKGQATSDRLEELKPAANAGQVLGNRARKLTRAIRESNTVRGMRVQESDRNNSRDFKTIRQLADANLNLSVGTYGAIRFCLGISLGVGMWFLLGSRPGLEGNMRLLAALGGMCLGMLIPSFIVRKKGKKRKLALLNSMPDAMDLLVISTGAGLGFDASVLRIAEYDNSPCIQELKMVMNDVQHGIPKREAYSAMAARCSVQEVTAFVNAILQSEEMGVPVSDVLKDQAETLRTNRRLRAEEKANKAPVKMTVPLVMCIFPAIFAVLLGPAITELYEVLG